MVLEDGFNIASPVGVHRIIHIADKAIRKATAGTTTLKQIEDSRDGDPFRVLIGTVLSQRTRDPVTALASSRLFSRYPDVKSLSKADT
ncbi:MAG TPA: hypothetical protein VE177_00445, partial [Candidatus Binatus sp.]|nr:hypothetical protein [Candidatus Binatus sp.]